MGPEEQRILTERAGRLLPMFGTETRERHWTTPGTGKEVRGLDRYSPDHGMNPVRLETLDPTVFGSAERLQKDRLWLAQTNRMRAVQRLAIAEYERDQDRILAWYGRKVAANAEVLLDACARGSLRLLGAKYITPDERRALIGTDWSFVHGFASHAVVEVEALMWGGGPAWYSKVVRWHCDGIPDRGGLTDSPHLPKTRLGDGHFQRAGVFASIRPETPAAVAWLCGCTPEDLPWQLQHYYSERLKPYNGNSILDRLDAEDFLDNPWRNLKLSVAVLLTRTTANARRKRLGLPRMDWDTLQRTPKGNAP